MKLHPWTKVTLWTTAGSIVLFGLIITARHAPERETAAYVEQLQTQFPQLKGDVERLQLGDPTLDDRDRVLAQLGRKLFFDINLSKDQRFSCATCHQPDRSFTDGLPVAQGHQLLKRNTPTLVNMFATFWFFWDGRADSLAAQAIGPLENPLEHHFSRAEVAQHIAANYGQEYAALFAPIPHEFRAHLPAGAQPVRTKIKLSSKVVDQALTSMSDPSLLKDLVQSAQNLGLSSQAAFAAMIDDDFPSAPVAETAYASLPPAAQTQLSTIVSNVGLALEAYQRGLVANQSPFDAFAKRWLAGGDSSPVSVLNETFGYKELIGLMLFTGKAECTLCHTGGNFSDNQFHNIGLPYQGEPLSLGRSTGILHVLADPFNCRNVFATLPGRHEQESCKDLPYLDPDSPEAIGSFKTPTLRNVADTSPYMHDGRLATLRDVINHYNRMNTRSALGYREETLKPLNLSLLEMDALEAFLRSLSSNIRDLSAN